MVQPSVLIVDDEKLIREALRLDLLAQGYAVDLAASGEDAVVLLAGNEYDLIITDLLMEGMSGLEVLRLAKDKRPEQLVFILTGYGELESAVEALRLGADDYLVKPYDHDELILRIASKLNSQNVCKTAPSNESLLSICSECKKIRDGEADGNGHGNWIGIEQFIGKMTGSILSHGICPDCFHRRMSELNDMIRRGRLSPST